MCTVITVIDNDLDKIHVHYTMCSTVHVQYSYKLINTAAITTKALSVIIALK